MKPHLRASLIGFLVIGATGPASGTEGLPPGADPDVDSGAVSEFDGNYGLGAIGADKALELGYTGRGITVGIIDSGIDIRPDGTSHLAFGDRIDDRSHSYLYWFDPSGLSEAQPDGEIDNAFDQGNATQDLQGHGSHVAGIIGSGRDGQQMHGVAPSSTLLAIKAIGQNGETAAGSPVQYGEVCGPEAIRTNSVETCDLIEPGVSPIVAAFRYMADQDDVGVINGSFGPSPSGADQRTWRLELSGDFFDTRLEAASVAQALNAGQIVVMAAGNARIDHPFLAENPVGIGLMPFIRPENADATNASGALIYDDHGLDADFSFLSAESLAAAERRDGRARGRVVVVAALDARNQLATYSNKCGVAQDWCLSAPGGDQPGLSFDQAGIGDRGILSTVPGNGSAYMSGTSMAAPHVTGAVAVLLEAYPGFAPSEVVGVLFRTAQDLGVPGVDPVFGWGLLRLDRALSGPVGMDTRDTGTPRFSTDSGDREWGFAFSSRGGFEKSGTGLLDIRAPVTFNRPSRVLDGPLAVNGTLTVPTLTVGQAGSLGGTGMILSDVGIDGSLAPGNSPGTLTIAGDVAIGSGAVVDIEIDGPQTGSGAGSYDRLIVLGDGSVFTAGGTLAPVFRGISGPADNSFVPRLGQVFDIVVVPDGRVSGAFSRLDQPDAGLPAGTRMDALYQDQAIGVAATPRQYADLGALGIPLTHNGRSLAGAIDTIRPEPGQRPDGGLNDTFNALYRADRTALSRDFDTLTGRIHAEMARATLRSIGRFSDVLATRQTGGVAGVGSRMTEDGYGSGQLWITGYGGRGRSEDGSGDTTTRVDDRATGFAVGLERRFGAATAGAAIAHDAVALDAGRHGDGEISGYHGGLYVTVPTDFIDIAMRGGATYGDLGTDRQTVLGAYQATATSDSRGFGQFADATVSRTFSTPAADITPSLSIGYRHFARGSSHETGSAFSLDAGAQAADRLSTEIGATVTRTFTAPSGTTVTPTLSLGWRHDIKQPSRQADLRLAGAPFSVVGNDHGPDALIAGIDVLAEGGGAWTFGASLDAELRENFTAYGASARAVMRF